MGMLRSEPDTEAIREPASPTRRRFLRYLQACASPDPFDPCVIDPPAVMPQQAGDLPIPLPTGLACTLDHRLGPRRFVVRRRPLIPRRGARVAPRPTGASFGDAQRGAAVLNRLPSTRWAQQCPSAASFRINVSR